jgi:hypothetical protein
MVKIRIGSECTTEMQLRVTEVRETHLKVACVTVLQLPAKVNDFVENGVPVTRDKGNLIWICYRLREFHYDLLVPAHP